MPLRRKPLMEISENDATSSQAAASSGRRKSGRAVKVPEKFVPDVPSSQLTNGNSKRKRGAPDDEDEENDTSDDEQSEDEEESADEEELKERAKKARKPATKKARVNGKAKVNGATAHTSAPPVKLPTRPKKSRLIALADDTAEGLYAEIFAAKSSPRDVAAMWATRFEENNAEALCDLVNALLKSAGCDEKITEHDIEDVDNIPNKLNDLSEEYEHQTIVDYPLISKAKVAGTFKSKLTEFCSSLVATIHESGILYTEEPLIENITLWVTSMAETKIRPFRHTATVVAMSFVSGLCQAEKNQADSTAQTLRMIENEKKKKKSSNKARVTELEQIVKDGKARSGSLETAFTHYWDGIFAHRYKDVDPKIRVECAEGIGSWARILPEKFLEGTRLRYLGWMLSDLSGPVRQEVVKQLEKLFKVQDNHGALRHFIERFRERMVQMATRDCDTHVRISTLELLDAVREAGMLEPDDIDIIGKLVFDSELQVRKAVANFFIENVNESYDAKIEELAEELGGREALDTLVVDDPDDLESPRLSWIKLKCLAELLLAYDSEESADIPSQIERGGGSNSDFLNASGVESRFSKASQALFGNKKIPEIQEWEGLVGYLLFDKSMASSQKADPQTQLMQSLQLAEKEELILLEIVNASVKLNIENFEESSKAKDKGRKKKVSSVDRQDGKESLAVHLATLMPRLLSKYGSSPDTATIVLRLEQSLNLSVFKELRQDSTSYAGLLDNISNQFTGHEDQKVLSEASAAFLHARSFEDLEDVTEEKVRQLWEDVSSTLYDLVRGVPKLANRGNLKRDTLTLLSNTVYRVSKLAPISDCVEALESKENSPKEPITILLEIVARGNLEDPDPEVDDLEDELVSSAMRSVLFYFMWKIRAIKMDKQDEMPQDEKELFTERRIEFSDYLVQALSTRVDIDDFRLLATGTFLDFYALFSTLRNDYPELVMRIGPEAQAELISIFVGAEKQYAKKAGKPLEPPEDDEEPEDDEDELEDDTPITDSERQNDILMAEKKLCELTGKIILALVAGVVDEEDAAKGKLRARLQRNRQRLGANFRAAIAYLDEFQQKEKKSHKSKAQQAVAASKKAFKSQEVVEDEDDPIIDEQEENQNGDGNGDEEVAVNNDEDELAMDE